MPKAGLKEDLCHVYVVFPLVAAAVQQQSYESTGEGEKIRGERSGARSVVTRL